MDFKIDSQQNTPLYKQITEQFDQEIQKGTLKPGQRLPTDRELSSQIGVSRGTVKAAYEELTRMGKIQKTQGKGTFIAGGTQGNENKYIEEMLKKLFDKIELVDMIEEEVDQIARDCIWQNLKNEEKVKIAWVDCSLELLQETKKQIEKNVPVKVTAYVLDEVMEAKSLTDEKYDFVATTLRHYPDLVNCLGERPMAIERVSLRIADETLKEFVKIENTSKVAIFYESKPFLRLIQDHLDEFGIAAQQVGYAIKNEMDIFIEKIEAYQCVIVPFNETQEHLMPVLESCKERGITVIEFKYHLDKGSLHHLEERAMTSWFEKALQ